MADDECAICLELNTPVPLRRSPRLLSPTLPPPPPVFKPITCRHQFHLDCIRQSVRQERIDGTRHKHRCPVCRTKYDAEDLFEKLLPPRREMNVLINVTPLHPDAYFSFALLENDPTGTSTLNVLPSVGGTMTWPYYQQGNIYRASDLPVVEYNYRRRHVQQQQPSPSAASAVPSPLPSPQAVPALTPPVAPVAPPVVAPPVAPAPAPVAPVAPAAAEGIPDHGEPIDYSRILMQARDRALRAVVDFRKVIRDTRIRTLDHRRRRSRRTTTTTTTTSSSSSNGRLDSRRRGLQRSFARMRASVNRAFYEMIEMEDAVADFSTLTTEDDDDDDDDATTMD